MLVRRSQYDAAIAKLAEMSARNAELTSRIASLERETAAERHDRLRLVSGLTEDEIDAIIRTCGNAKPFYNAAKDGGRALAEACLRFAFVIKGNRT